MKSPYIPITMTLFACLAASLPASSDVQARQLINYPNAYEEGDIQRRQLINYPKAYEEIDVQKRQLVNNPKAYGEADV